MTDINPNCFFLSGNSSGWNDSETEFVYLNGFRDGERGCTVKASAGGVFSSIGSRNLHTK
jgi:hypothetical protein